MKLKKKLLKIAKCKYKKTNQIIQYKIVKFVFNNNLNKK